MRVLRGVGWDKKEFIESNLHVYGGDDNRMIVYYMERWPKKSERKNIREKRNPGEESTEYC